MLKKKTLGNSVDVGDSFKPRDGPGNSSAPLSAPPFGILKKI